MYLRPIKYFRNTLVKLLKPTIVRPLWTSFKMTTNISRSKVYHTLKVLTIRVEFTLYVTLFISKDEIL